MLKRSMLPTAKWTPQQIRDYQENEPIPTEQDVCNLGLKHPADRYIWQGTVLSWQFIRKLVWIRDEGTCDVCNIWIREEQYQCGHIVDRICGGMDRLDNVVVMCEHCNRSVKILHETKEEYLEWRGTAVIEYMRSIGEQPCDGDRLGEAEARAAYLALSDDQLHMMYWAMTGK